MLGVFVDMSYTVGWLVFPTRFQPLGYARITGVADSRRGADVNLHRPTSLSKEPSVPRGLRCLASIYDYVHLVLEVTCLPVFVFLGFSSCVYAILEASCVQRCSRLVEARLPRVLRLQYLQSPPSVQLSCVLACPDTPRAWSKFPDLRCSSSVVMSSTRFLCGCVVWCDLPPGAAAAAFRRDAALQERFSARACRRAYSA